MTVLLTGATGLLTGRVAFPAGARQIRERVVRWRGGGPPKPGRGRVPEAGFVGGGARSNRDVSVLPPWAVDLLAPRLLQRPHDDSSRFGGIDHVIDHRPTRRKVRVDLRADGL